jgi:hypothetical protein
MPASDPKRTLDSLATERLDRGMFAEIGTRSLVPYAGAQAMRSQDDPGRTLLGGSPSRENVQMSKVAPQLRLHSDFKRRVS